MRNLTVLAAVLVTACSDGGGGSTVGPPGENQSIGGIWEGTYADGNDIVGLVAEDGAFHFIDSLGQGFGTATVSSGNRVSATYTYVAQLDTAFSDGSTSAACTLTGTVVERRSLKLDFDCTSAQGSASQVSATLSYNALYDRDASFAAIEGLYDDLGDVLSIDGAGALFEQDATDGCVLNGRVSVIDPDFNAYRIEFGVESCNSGLRHVNGTTWSGIGVLDDTVAPEELIFGVVGDVTASGYTATFALLGVAPRI